jgi:adenosylhomocysteine nucleosidase
MSNNRGVVAVTCLALEARIALGPGVSVICSQGRELIAPLEAAVRRGAAGIISFGVAGGLSPKLHAGDWIVGMAILRHQERFVTHESWTRRLLAALRGSVAGDILGADAPVADADEKSRLHELTGAVAVDMESHIAAEIAAKHELPFAACRVILDASERNLPPAALLGLRHDGTADLPAICKSLARHPQQLPALFRTGRDARIAQRALISGRRLLGTHLAFPGGNTPPLPREQYRDLGLLALQD